jgi:hypothetical protein
MLPPQPQFSLPTAKYFRCQASARPLARRREDIGLWPAIVMYSSHSAISRTVPDPTLPHTYGSQPSCAHRSKNSCVPHALFSVVPPQCTLTIDGRFSCGPMPSIQ